jgi:hypothetical protein
MLAKLLETLTGKDDLERIAYKGGIPKLNAYLRTRKVLIPLKPTRFLDAANFTKEQLLEQIQKDLQEMNATPFEPWILKLDGKRRLPVSSSHTKLQTFSAKISQQMNKVFSLGSAEILLSEVTKNLDLDIVDLNLFSDKSWEIATK